MVDVGETKIGWDLTCHVADHAVLLANRAELAALRRQPGMVRGLEFPPALLRHSDEQSVAALAVIVKAMARQGQAATNYRDWAVVAGPSLFGRDPLRNTIQRFQSDGAWGVPPHSIPHCTLHAISGTISQALQIHGPNISVGIGPSAAVEAMLVAGTLLADENVPGVWLVLTGYEPEMLPATAEDVSCLAAAIALRRSSGQSSVAPSWKLHVADEHPSGLEDFTLARFHGALAGEHVKSNRWRLPAAGWLELGPSSDSRLDPIRGR